MFLNFPAESRLSRRLGCPTPVEELLKEWPELETFGVEWVKAWAPTPWRGRWKSPRSCGGFRGLLRQRLVGKPHPYMVEVYVAGGVPFAYSVKDFLHAGRLGEGDQARAGVLQI